MPRLALMPILLLVTLVQTASAGDPLPSWNEGHAKSAIMEFVQKVTTEGSPDLGKPLESRWEILYNGAF